MKSARLKKAWLLIASFLISATMWSQITKISGKVTSEDDSRALIGATIALKGKTEKTQTNSNGDFVINATKGDMLIISFTGYVQQEIKVDAISGINVMLKVSESKLDEVVVTGYGKQNRQTFAGAVSTVDQRALESSPSTNVATALQGTVPGLRVQQTTGQPGSSPSISFRGGTGFDGSGSPLIVLDGTIIPTMYGISMDDIESMSLLKDAATTAIYGARASNGVILIYTKKGKKGKAQLRYSFNQTQNYIRRNPLEYLDAAQYIQWNRRGIQSRYEADLADGNTSAANTDRTQLVGAWGWAVNGGWTSPIGLYSTQLLSNANRSLLGNPKWGLLIDPNPFVAGQIDSILYRSASVREREDQIIRNTGTQEHALNLSGASEQGDFALGIGFVNDNGMVIGSLLKRLNMNFNGSLNLGKNLKVRMTTSAYSVKSVLPYTGVEGGGSGGLMQRYVGVAPTIRLTNDTSGAILPGPNDVTLGNPDYWSDKFVNNSTQQRFTGRLSAEYSISPSLTLLASGSGFIINSNDNNFTKAFQQGSGGSMNTTRPASFAISNDYQYSYNAFLRYDKTFGEHNISVQGGAEFQDRKVYSYSGSASGASTDIIPWLVASLPASVLNGALQNPVNASSNFGIWDRLSSGIASVNYSYSNRYNLSANFRYDGTSRLSTNRYGFFPGFLARWNIHNENFFQKSNLSKYISVLGPRLSWGQNGNLNSIGNYATAQVYSNTAIYNGQGGATAPSFINSDLRWETATSLNLGLDLGLFNNRVSIIADYFVRDVFDKIASLPISAQTGFTGFTTNLGQLQNRGFEFEMKAKVLRPVKPNGLSLEVGANFMTVKNYVVKLPYNGLPNNRQNTIQVWDPSKPGQLRQVAGLQEGYRVGLDEVWAPSYNGIYLTTGDITKDAAVYNSFLPYTNKRLKMLGDARWSQVFQNDTIDSRQYKYVGRTTPSFMGGFSTVLRYKGFSLYGQFDYALNFVVLNQAKMRGLSQVQGSQNSTKDVLNTWSPYNTTGTLPRFYWANQGRNYATDASGNNPFAEFWERGDYLMIRELTLSYDMTQQVIKSIFNGKIRGARIFLSGSNLAYITRYSGNFPEVGSADNGRYPLPKRLTVGINLNL